MKLGVSHVQNLSSLTPIVDTIFDKYNKNLVPIRSLSDHDIYIGVRISRRKSWVFLCHVVAFCSQIQNIQLFLKRHQY